MSAIKTEIAQSAAQHQAFAPTSSIPKSDTWSAIVYVYNTLVASLALTQYTADDARSIAQAALGRAREAQRAIQHDNAQAVLNAAVFN